MKAVLYTLLALLILGGVCVATCPDREAHSEALKDLVNQVITAELSGEEEDADLVMFGSMIGTGLSGLVIDNMLNVEDYLVCSGETHVVSVGLLNHVFTIDEEKAAQIAGELF